MTLHADIARVAWVGLAALVIACSECAAAPNASRAAPCEPLQASASREPLSQLLRELSTVRSYRLENWTRDDPMVSHGGGSDIDLMTELSGQVNLIVRYKPLKRCRGQWGVDAIWILPGQVTVAAPNPSPVRSEPAPPAAADSVSPQAALDMYMRAHGLTHAPDGKPPQ